MCNQKRVATSENALARTFLTHTRPGGLLPGSAAGLPAGSDGGLLPGSCRVPAGFPAGSDGGLLPGSRRARMAGSAR